jgi:hypothetical protein
VPPLPEAMEGKPTECGRRGRGRGRGRGRRRAGVGARSRGPVVRGGAVGRGRAHPGPALFRPLRRVHTAGSVGARCEAALLAPRAAAAAAVTAAAAATGKGAFTPLTAGVSSVPLVEDTG